MSSVVTRTKKCCTYKGCTGLEPDGGICANCLTIQRAKQRNLNPTKISQKRRAFALYPDIANQVKWSGGNMNQLAWLSVEGATHEQIEEITGQRSFHRTWDALELIKKQAEAAVKRAEKAESRLAKSVEENRTAIVVRQRNAKKQRDFNDIISPLYSACACCGRLDRLQAAHIFGVADAERVHDLEGLWLKGNGILLCAHCHGLFDDKSGAAQLNLDNQFRWVYSGTDRMMAVVTGQEAAIPTDLRFEVLKNLERRQSARLQPKLQEVS